MPDISLWAKNPNFWLEFRHSTWKKRQSKKGMEGTSVKNTSSFQISTTLFDPTVEWRRIMILCISVLLVQLLYLDYWTWPIWTIFVLLLCQFIKSNLSSSTPNLNKCQKYKFMTSRNFSKFEMLTQFYIHCQEEQFYFKC